MKGKGNAGENRVRRELEAEAWVVGSMRETEGGGDLLGVRASRGPCPHIILVEVKANRAGGPFKNFGRLARESMLVEAELAGGKATLAYAPPGEPTRWISAEDWPR